MPKLHLKGELITPEEFQRWLEKARKESTYIGDLRETIEEMVIMEQKYGMTSEKFYEKFSRGEMGDDMDVIDWAGSYETYRRAKEIIEKELEKASEHHVENPDEVGEDANRIGG
ncbi:TPA: hypothetical protein EYP66_12815 [Candidatus Poribacteria bacterium]|nr:hypothetical protein [Candidatus Poribacteria bacterium]